MEKYTNDELLDVLNSNIRDSKELTTKQKAVLGQLVMYSGLDKKNEDGYFFRSNKDLSNDCEIQEKTLIHAVNKLVLMGFIDRISGSRKDGASLYRVNKDMIVNYDETRVDDYSKNDIEDYCKTQVEDYSNEYSKQLAEMSDRIRELEITLKKLVEVITVKMGTNYSTDTEIEKEIEKDKELENNNIIYNNKKIEKENSLYNNIEETVNSQELELIKSGNSQNEIDYSKELELAESEISQNEETEYSNELDSVESDYGQIEAEYSNELELAESEGNQIESQHEIKEVPSVDETIIEEQVSTSTIEKKQFVQECKNLLLPLILQIQRATSEVELSHILEKTTQTFKTPIFERLDDTSRINLYKWWEIYDEARREEIKKIHDKQIKEQLNRYGQYASYYC